MTEHAGDNDASLETVTIDVPQVVEKPAVENREQTLDMAAEKKMYKDAKRLERDRVFKSNMTRLIIMMVMVFVVFGVELGVGIAANSLALLSDAFHMLSDFMGLIIASVAMTVRL
jgi:Co/Zn/Cd efflux system component